MRPVVAIIWTIVPILVASPALAQTCGTILTDCAGSGDPLDHVVPELVPNNRTHIHAECVVCMINFQPQYPTACHWPCPPDDGLSVEEEVAYRKALQVADRNDVRGVLELASHLPRHLVFHDTREALQLLDCGWRVVANVPIDRGDPALAFARELSEAGRITVLSGADVTLAYRGR